MKHFLLLCFIFLIFPYQVKAGPVLPTSLCQNSEQILFSCKIQKNQKVLSLCGVKPTASDVGYMVYRFGSDQKIELEYPKNKKDSFSHFSTSSYHRGGGMQNAGLDLRSIVFVNEGFSYEIHSDYSAEFDAYSRGVKILNGQGKLIAEFNCQEPAIDNIGSSNSPGGWIYEKIEDVLPQCVNLEKSLKADLVIQGNIENIAPHGWGYSDRVNIKQITKGKLEEKVIHLNTSLLMDTSLFRFYFKKDKPAEHVPAGSAGFVDSSGMLWILIDWEKVDEKVQC